MQGPLGGAGMGTVVCWTKLFLFLGGKGVGVEGMTRQDQILSTKVC